MIYTEHPPHPDLAAFIDAYWWVKGAVQEHQTGLVLPDGCVDIIFNAGADSEAEEDGSIMKHGHTYLVGTMTHFSESVVTPDTQLLGIRFKTAAFRRFFRFGSLQEATDNSIELEQRFANGVVQSLRHGPNALNRFFLEQHSATRHPLEDIIADIRRNKGIIRIGELARRHFITPRQLERHFLQETGISPKAFANFVRYESAHKAIRNNRQGLSLQDIALDHGYYDHAHLANAIKAYTGRPPSLL